MKYCEKCGINIRGTEQRCPLCFSALEAIDDEAESTGYPELRTFSAKGSFLVRLFVFFSVAGSLTCLLINLLCWQGVLWSLIVVTGLLLVWKTVGLMILSRRNVGLKVIAQTVAVLLLLITIDAVTGWNQWSIGIVTPFVIIAATCVMTIVLYVKRAKWREYMLFQLVITINGFIPVILALCGLTKIVWPGAVGALYSLLTFVGMLLFANRQFKSELKKRFHV
jgi:hypothetical protein